MATPDRGCNSSPYYENLSVKSVPRLDHSKNLKILFLQGNTNHEVAPLIIPLKPRSIVSMDRTYNPAEFCAFGSAPFSTNNLQTRAIPSLLVIFEIYRSLLWDDPDDHGLKTNQNELTYLASNFL